MRPDVRASQDRNAIVESRLRVQLRERTITAPRKRFFGGALDLPASPAAPPTTLATTRLLTQSQSVARELSLEKLVAGPGAIQ